ncbi:MAG: T9SS C-terminal target domain-containing protein [Calditrichaeota bacterium]|nr:agmatine deiminase family protein [Calditrichota bacterium]RQW07442.1 MAG: T9SS C-terminal target domain-containing protein [Calditrichota bacterium]
MDCKIIYFFLTILTFSPLLSQHINPLPRGLTDREKLLLADYKPPGYSENVTSPPPYPVRTPAEWEELQAIAITWTSFTSILTEIVRHAREECAVYIICSDSNTVRSNLYQAGIPSENIRFLQAAYNSIWIRDYGPWSVYAADSDSVNIIDWIYNRPRPYDDLIPGIFAQTIQAPFFATTTPPYNLVHTGGNFLVDGRGTAFSSKLILQENPEKTGAEIDTILKKFMGINRFIKLDVLPYDGIHHIDMHMKLLDEETILMGEYPAGISDGPQIEANLSYILNNFKTCYGRDFRVIRIPMPPDGNGRYPSQGGDYRTYTNSLIINKTVLIPTYEYRYDTTAFRIYREAMPGYELQGINCNSIIPLNGALHCIVKEISAYHPIQISHAPIRSASDTSTFYSAEADISSVIPVIGAELFWTSDTSLGFTMVPMRHTGSEHYAASIPAQTGDTQIFYYISATSASGKTIARPMTAPQGLFGFTVETVSKVKTRKSQEVEKLILSQNYPNPFNSSTTIHLYIPASEEIHLSLFNAVGELVKVLHKEHLPAGEHNFKLDAGNMASGVYFYSIRSRSQILTRKLLLLK